MESEASTPNSTSRDHEDMMVEDTVVQSSEDETLSKLDDAKKSVKEEILTAIEPYTKSNDKLYLSPAELAVIAVLCLHDGKYVNDLCVSKWVMKKFPYYMDEAVSVYCYQDDYDDNEDGFRGTFSRFSRTALNSDWDVPLQEHGDLKNRKLYVDPCEGRIFLRRLLEPKREGAFRFLDLPAEIRVTIYEYVFTFPRSGLGFRGLSDRCLKQGCGLYPEAGLIVQRAERGDIKNASMQKWSRSSRLDHRRYVVRDEDYMLSSPTNSILALLSANKQIYLEAMPYFYRVNHFYVPTLDALKHLLGGCGAQRRKHFTSVAFTYDFENPYPAKTVGQNRNTAATAFDLLGGVKSLRFLQIEATEAKGTGEPLRYWTLAINALKKIRVEKLEFIGQSSKIEEYLKEGTTKLKQQEGITSRGHGKLLEEAASTDEESVEADDEEM